MTDAQTKDCRVEGEYLNLCILDKNTKYHMCKNVVDIVYYVF